MLHRVRALRSVQPDPPVLCLIRVQAPAAHCLAARDHTRCTRRYRPSPRSRPGNPGSSPSWRSVMMVLVFGAGWITSVALTDIAAEAGGARSIPALATSFAWFGAGIGGVLMGRVANRFGTRSTVVFGAFMVGTGLAISTLARPSRSGSATRSSWGCSASAPSMRRCTSTSATGSTSAAARRWLSFPAAAISRARCGRRCSSAR